MELIREECPTIPASLEIDADTGTAYLWSLRGGRAQPKHTDYRFFDKRFSWRYNEDNGEDDNGEDNGEDNAPPFGGILAIQDGTKPQRQWRAAAYAALISRRAVDVFGRAARTLSGRAVEFEPGRALASAGARHRSLDRSQLRAVD